MNKRSLSTAVLLAPLQGLSLKGDPIARRPARQWIIRLQDSSAARSVKSRLPFFYCALFTSSSERRRRLERKRKSGRKFRQTHELDTPVFRTVKALR